MESKVSYFVLKYFITKTHRTANTVEGLMEQTQEGNIPKYIFEKLSS